MDEFGVLLVNWTLNGGAVNKVEDSVKSKLNELTVKSKEIILSQPAIVCKV